MEQKAAKAFEQKAAKVTKNLGSTVYVDVLQAQPSRPFTISENKPVDAVFQHDLVKVDQYALERSVAVCEPGNSGEAQTAQSLG
jgi:hypothetical protein